MTAPTELLIRVANAADVETALAAGADRLGLMESVATTDVAGIVAIVAGRRPIGAAVSHAKDAEGAAQAGVDWLEVPAGQHAAARLAAVRREHPALRGVVVFAAAYAAPPNLTSYADQGFDAALLTSGTETPLRLLERLGIEGLAQFVAAARQCGLQAWIGGDLEPPDIPRLLALAPHGLVVRGRPARGGGAPGPLDPARLAMIRSLMPVSDEPAQPAAGADMKTDPDASGDRVFVRDFVVTAGIGAYDYERGAPQRLRFNVDADIARIPDDVADVSDIFSYDVIIDAIALATRTHVQLVERLALDVADATLRDGRVNRVRVRVEKLDILAGSVGVEIERSRTSLAATSLATTSLATAGPRPHVRRP